MRSAIQIGHGRLGGRCEGGEGGGGGGIWRFLIFVSVADGISGECYSSRSQVVYYGVCYSSRSRGVLILWSVLFESVAGSTVLWSVVQVGHGGGV